ncbi:MAG: hypothetical protein H6658_13350 [Ardenticatenaceae bacterium]|nr:hypothetical protein [Ardenticatenaceae bacterium]
MVANTSMNYLSSQIQPDIAALRLRLKQLNVWPAAGDQFLTLLAQTRTLPDKLTPDDREWIVLVAKDALRSCDIGARYPAFFQKLFKCPDLLQAFLTELDRLQH